MTTLELPWLDLYLGETHRFSEQWDTASYVLQWHTAASTLYIVCKDRHEIDLRIEREIYEIKYEDVTRTEDAKTQVLYLRMHDSRPVKWAKGTDFVPGYTEHAGIAIKVNIADPGSYAIYAELTKWLRRTAFTGATESMSRRKANELWQWVSREILVLDPDMPDAIQANPIVLHNMTWGDLRQGDIDRLMRVGQYASDAIIQFGMNVFLSFIQEDDAREDLNLHLFDTFFYEKLCREGCVAAARHTAKANLFNKDLLVFPINTESHWFLVVVDKPGLALDELGDDSHGEPEITTGDPGDNHNEATKEDTTLRKAKLYVMDSYPLLGTTTVVNNILQHLRFEALRKQKKQFNLGKVEQYFAKVPKQPNGHECGYYLLHFFFLFINDPDKYRTIIQSGRREDADKNWNVSQVNGLRHDLQNFVNQVRCDAS